MVLAMKVLERQYRQQGKTAQLASQLTFGSAVTAPVLNSSNLSVSGFAV
jgi:hypothetical protein